MKNNDTADLEVLYSLALAEMESLTLGLETFEKETEKPIAVLETLIEHKYKVEYDTMKAVTKNLLKSFFKTRNALYNVKSIVNKYERRLKLFLDHNDTKKKTFSAEYNRIMSDIKSKEAILDGYINQCLSLMNEFKLGNSDNLTW